MRHTSVWVDTGPQPDARPRLEANVDADVAVIGGGIVGITTALLLQEAGARVVLLEAGRLAGGVSGYTTAKVSSQHGMIYERLRSEFGAASARTYGAANEAALAWMADRVERDVIDCDFRRRASYAYLGPDADRSDAEREAEAALAAGLPASLVEETPLPYRSRPPCASTTRRSSTSASTCSPSPSTLDEVYEHSHAVQVDADERCTVKTPGGSVTADHVVVATHYPFLDRALAFARVSQQRSYALLCRIAGAPPEGMFISGDSPTRSVRAVPLDGEELLLVGGEGHKTGEGGDTEERYRTLERFAREHWDVESVAYRWSSQDGTTIDGVPYVGPLTPGNEQVVMATGFAKWGMTGGTAAAMILADRLTGRENPWAGLFNPNRVKPRAAVKFVEENAKVGLHFVGDRLTKRARGRSRTSRPARATSCATPARRSPATAATTARSSPSPRSAPTSAARSTGTRPSAAGTAPATARASVPRARCSTARPCTGSRPSRSGSAESGAARHSRRELGDDLGGGLDRVHRARRLAGVERHRADRARRLACRRLGAEARDRDLRPGQPQHARLLLGQRLGRLDRAAQHAVRPRLGHADVEGRAHDRVGGLGIEHRPHPFGMGLGLAAAMKRVPTRAPSAPAAKAAATPRAVAIPPAATTGSATASSTSSSSGISAGPSMRLRPPDSQPLAMTTSQPAASAARASSADSTCQPQTAPPACTISTSAGSGSPKKKSTYGERSTASSSEPGFISAGTKLTPNAPVRAASASSTGASACGGSPSAEYIPWPPAVATASGSAAVADTLPIGASWIGRSQCSSSVTRVATHRAYA